MNLTQTILKIAASTEIGLPFRSGGGELPTNVSNATLQQLFHPQWQGPVNGPLMPGGTQGPLLESNGVPPAALESLKNKSRVSVQGLLSSLKDHRLAAGIGAGAAGLAALGLAAHRHHTEKKHK